MADDGIEYRTNENGGQDAIVSVPMAVAEGSAPAPSSMPTGMQLPPGYTWDELDEDEKATLVEFHNTVMTTLQGAGIWVVPIGGDEHPEGHEWATVQRGSNALLGTYRDQEHAEIVGVAFARHLGVPLNIQSEDGRITSTTTFPVPS